MYSNEVNDNNAIDHIKYDNYTFTMHVINLPVLLTVPTLYSKTMSSCSLMYIPLLYNMNELLCFQCLIAILNVNYNIHCLINLYAKIFINLCFAKFQSHYDHISILISNAISFT